MSSLIALFPVVERNRWGFINVQGSVVIPCKYDIVSEFSDAGLAAVKLEGRRYFIDEHGNTVLGVSNYDYVGRFSDGIAMVVLKGASTDLLYSFIGLDGKELWKQRYKRASEFEGGFARVQVNGRYGFIDKTGRTVIRPEFEDCSIIRAGESHFAFEEREKWGIKRTDGKTTVSPRFQRAGEVRNGLCNVKLDGKQGLIDCAGNTVIEHKYDGMRSIWQEGLVGAAIGEKWGFVNIRTGNQATDFRFTDVHHFSEGLAGVYVGGRRNLDNYPVEGKCGFISQSGQLIVEAKFDDVEHFRMGLALVRVGDVANLDFATGYISKDGQYVWKPKR
jgi:hypothetical protein